MAMVGKKVIYNGGKDSYYGCTEPTALIVGKKYKVVRENVRAWQTDLQLKGVDGEFNSVWFYEAKRPLITKISKIRNFCKKWFIKA